MLQAGCMNIITHIKNSFEHVLNVATNCAETGHLFPGGKPNVNSDSLLSHTGQLQVNVLKRLGESPTRTFDCDLTALACYSHCREFQPHISNVRVKRPVLMITMAAVHSVAYTHLYLGR